jgi:UDP-N-acetylmuramate dehydrogenase
MNKNPDPKDLLTWLSSKSVEFSTSVSLSNFSWFKTGGIADVIISPDSKNQLSMCIDWIRSAGFNFKVVGETSNLIFLDDIDYSVLITTTRISALYYNSDSSLIVAECGALLPALSRYALSLSAKGFEGLEGIPGTVGAAVFMNAGAYGDEIKDVIESVDVILPDGSIKTHSLGDLKLSHRNSVFRSETNDEIIISASFRVNPGDSFEIYNRMSLFHSKRHKYQEFMYPTLGSVYSGSIYRVLAKKDIWFKFVSGIYYLIFYKWKIFRRESPDNRKWLNDFTVSRFGISYENQPFSNKDMNTLVNNGHHTDEILSYINQLNSMVGSDIVIENEIVEKF